MVVTTSAGHRQTQPHRGRRLGAIEDVFDAGLFRNPSSFAVVHVVAIETTGDNLLIGGTRDQVSRQHLPGELIKRHVVIQGMNQPIPPGPHGSGRVILKSIGIGVSSSLQPIPCHPFSVPGRLEESINRFFVSIRRFVLQEFSHFGFGRWHACQVECHATKQLRSTCRPGRTQLLPFQSSEDEMINRVRRPGLQFHFRQTWFLRFDKGPMFLPWRTVFHPASELFLFFLGQFDFRLRRRHDVRLVVRQNPLNGLTRIDVASDKSRISTQVRKCIFPQVQSQTGFPGVFIWTMTMKALASQNRPNVFVKIDFIAQYQRGVCRYNQHEQQSKNEGAHHCQGLGFLFRFNSIRSIGSINYTPNYQDGCRITCRRRSK